MKRILIVEDDEMIADMEKRVLEEEEFQVKVAGDRVEGLEKIKQNVYDIIITDCEMHK
jgi:DNA-binding response OmpR family regulator